MSTIGKTLTVWVAALVACLCGLLAVTVMGLSIPGSVIVPLAMGSGALLAALTATWVGSFLLAEDGTRSRLLPVVGVTEVAAVALAGIVMALALLEIPVSLITFLLASAVLLAGAATAAAQRLRTPHVNVQRDLGVSLVLVAVAVLVVVGGIPALCSTALTCAP